MQRRKARTIGGACRALRRALRRASGREPHGAGPPLATPSPTTSTQPPQTQPSTHHPLGGSRSGPFPPVEQHDTLQQQQKSQPQLKRHQRKGGVAGVCDSHVWCGMPPMRQFSSPAVTRRFQPQHDGDAPCAGDPPCLSVCGVCGGRAGDPPAPLQTDSFYASEGVRAEGAAAGKQTGASAVHLQYTIRSTPESASTNVWT
ncbi:hypothetical protein PLESTB_000014400 [Pleodorina starrii]|uniref:Uncharacterized protein n=1 Tax=Pleodorina starrii TaxID=330485 RepID=A0A9W6B9I5_9CHLO|nr:hypothetical protein PLESTM_001120100 [Pleodorina starrii]GLC47678.1 hypothetical protein PLESTB_000014400 [Pleodorina starrii]GLC70910.1 hypothetical protein PLESTF_001045800 [Pleodorina starrii]